MTTVTIATVVLIAAHIVWLGYLAAMPKPTKQEPEQRINRPIRQAQPDQKPDFNSWQQHLQEQRRKQYGKEARS